MSTPNSTSRRNAQGQRSSSQVTPNTPIQPQRIVSLEPQSEYLRSALQQRINKATTPTHTPVIQPPSRPQSTSPAPSSDPWVDHAVLDDHASAPNTLPSRRTRRTSDSTSRPLPMRRPTHREMEDQQMTLKQTNFDLSLKLRLVEEQKNKLFDELDAAKSRIEELEPLEEDNQELREDNDQLRLRVQDMEEDIAQYQDEHAEHLATHSEMIEEMEKRDAALEEAADMIYKLEQENMALRKQVASCTQVTGGSDYYSTDDSPKKRIPHVRSVESRPSTGYNSDYYSQPASPQVKANMNAPSAQTLGPYSEKAKELVHRASVGRNSVTELRKRFSQISLTPEKSRARSRSKSPEPPVPPIPTDITRLSGPPREPRPMKRFGERYQAKDFTTSDLESPEPSPEQPETPTQTAPGTSTGQSLRGYYRSGDTVRSRRSSALPSDINTSREQPLRTFLKSETSCNSTKSSPVTPPPRVSSRYAHTTSSGSQASQQTAHSHASIDSLNHLHKPSPVPSLESEHTSTEIDNREKWWKDVERTIPQNPFGGSRGDRAMRLRGDFFFNAGENEEQFAQRARQFNRRR